VRAHLFEKDYFGIDVVGHKISVCVYFGSVNFYGAGTDGRGHADLNARK